MRMSNFRELIVLGSVLIGALTAVGGWVGWGGRSLVGDADLSAAAARLSAAGPQEQDEDIAQLARKAFMRGKLASNQKIIEGLSTKNFGLIAEGAEEIKALVKGQHWFVLRTPEYQGYSAEMQLAAGRLVQAAENRNVEAAALRYFDLTLNCLDCHGYIEKQKY